MSYYNLLFLLFVVIELIGFSIFAILYLIIGYKFDDKFPVLLLSLMIFVVFMFAFNIFYGFKNLYFVLFL
jgi:hypothetical protein